MPSLGRQGGLYVSYGTIFHFTSLSLSPHHDCDKEHSKLQRRNRLDCEPRKEIYDSGGQEEDLLHLVSPTTSKVGLSFGGFLFSLVRFSGLALNKRLAK